MFLLVALPRVVAIVVGGDVAPPLAVLLRCNVLDADAALVDGGALVANVLHPAREVAALSLLDIVDIYVPQVLAGVAGGDVGDLAPLPEVVALAPELDRLALPDLKEKNVYNMISL